MKIVVCVKSAIDEAELDSDLSGHPRLQGAATKMGTFDRNAVEEALRQKEAAIAGGETESAVTVVMLGPPESRKAVKEALAMGCERAVLILAEGDHDALATSRHISGAIEGLGAGLILFSEGSSDTYQGEVGPMVAEFLGLPFLAYARKLEVDQSSGRVRCEQSFEDGVRVSEAALPAAVSVVSEANEPRYPTLLQIMQASKKPIEELPISPSRDSAETGFRVLEIVSQPTARKKILFEGVPEEAAAKLVDALRREGVIEASGVASPE